MLNDAEKLPPSTSDLWPSVADWQKIEAAKQAYLEILKGVIVAKIESQDKTRDLESTPPWDLPFLLPCSVCSCSTPQIRSVKADNGTAGYICFYCGFMNKP